MNRTIKAVFFDIGETLIDETRPWSLLADWLGVPRMTLFAVLGGLIAEGKDHRELIDVVRPDIGWNGLMERYRSEAPTGLIPEDLYPDVRPTLARLKDGGLFIGIAGNQPVETEKDLRSMTLPADLIATSAGWGLKKPDPAFFRKVVDDSGCSPNEIAYVGDRVDNDVLPAAKAGMAAIHIVRGPWGYLQRDWPGVRNARAQIRNLSELPDILQGL